MESLAHAAASEPSGAAPQDETRPREPLRAASLKAAGISEPLSAASKPGRKVRLFTLCSPKNFTPCNFVATKRDPTASKKLSRDLYAPGLAYARD